MSCFDHIIFFFTMSRWQYNEDSPNNINQTFLDKLQPTHFLMILTRFNISARTKQRNKQTNIFFTDTVAGEIKSSYHYQTN